MTNQNKHIINVRLMQGLCGYNNQPRKAEGKVKDDSKSFERMLEAKFKEFGSSSIISRRIK